MGVFISYFHEALGMFFRMDYAGVFMVANKKKVGRECLTLILFYKDKGNSYAFLAVLMHFAHALTVFSCPSTSIVVF